LAQSHGNFSHKAHEGTKNKRKLTDLFELLIRSNEVFLKIDLQTLLDVKDSEWLFVYTFFFVPLRFSVSLRENFRVIWFGKDKN
jgi:hypothetical protein